jgi:hypothetical protein
MPSIQQDTLWDDSNDKRPLISESLAAIWIGVHPAGEEPDQHIIHVATHVSRMTTIHEVPTKSNLGPCSQDEVLACSDRTTLPSSLVALFARPGHNNIHEHKHSLNSSYPSSSWKRGPRCEWDLPLVFYRWLSTKQITSSHKKVNTSTIRIAYGMGTTWQPITISSKNPTLHTKHHMH